MKKATTDFAEEEVPASSGGSRPRFELLLEAQENVCGPLGSSRGAGAGRREGVVLQTRGPWVRDAGEEWLALPSERALGPNNAYIDYLELADSKKRKRRTNQSAGTGTSGCARSEQKGVRRGPARRVVENLDAHLTSHVPASITAWIYFICVTASPWTPRSQ
jgi:hypothetical protein